MTDVVTNVCLDRRSAQRQREAYVGPWLPEPLLTDLDPAAVRQAASRGSSASATAGSGA